MKGEALSDSLPDRVARELAANARSDEEIASKVQQQQEQARIANQKSYAKALQLNREFVHLMQRHRIPTIGVYTILYRHEGILTRNRQYCRHLGDGWPVHQSSIGNYVVVTDGRIFAVHGSSPTSRVTPFGRYRFVKGDELYIAQQAKERTYMPDAEAWADCLTNAAVWLIQTHKH